MKKFALFFILLLTASQLRAGEKKLSVASSYPITIGNNFMSQFYNGVFDLNLQFKFVKKRALYAGVSVNTALYTSFGNDFPFTQGLKTNSWSLLPRVFVGVDFDKLHGSIGIGGLWQSNSTYYLYCPSGHEGPFNPLANQFGFDMNATLEYDVANKLFLITQFDYSTFSSEYFSESGYDASKMETLKFGLGWRF